MGKNNTAFCIARISAMSIAVFMVTMMVYYMQLLNMNHPFYLGAIITMWLLIIVAIAIVVRCSYLIYRDNEIMNR